MRALELRLGSRALEDALERAVIVEDGVEVPVVPAAIDEHARTVRFARPSLEGRPSTAALWWAAVRPFSLTATLTPALATLVYGSLHGMAVHVVVTVFAVLGALLLQVGVNLSNDVEDHLRLVDLPGGLGGAGLIQRGWLKPASVRRSARVALGAGVVAGLPAFVAHPRPIAIIGALGLFGAFGYSGRPFGLKYRALGDLTVLVLCGPGLTFGVAYAAFGRADAGVAILGAFFGLLALGILHANNLQDRALDARRQAHTVALHLGERGGRIYLAATYALAALMPIASWLRGDFPRAVALVTLAGTFTLAKVVGEVWASDDLSAPVHALLRVRAARAHLLLGGLLLVALIVRRMFGVLP